MEEYQQVSDNSQFKQANAVSLSKCASKFSIRVLFWKIGCVGVLCLRMELSSQVERPLAVIVRNKPHLPSLT